MLNNETKRYIYERVMNAAKEATIKVLNESFDTNETIEILVSARNGQEASTAVISAPTKKECVEKLYVIMSGASNSEYFKLKPLVDNIKTELNAISDDDMEWLDVDAEQLHYQVCSIEDIDDFILAIENA